MRSLVARSFQHGRDRSDRSGRPYAERPCGQANAQAAVVRKPFSARFRWRPRKQFLRRCHRLHTHRRILDTKPSFDAKLNWSTKRTVNTRLTLCQERWAVSKGESRFGGSHPQFPKGSAGVTMQLRKWLDAWLKRSLQVWKRNKLRGKAVGPPGDHVKSCLPVFFDSRPRTKL